MTFFFHPFFLLFYLFFFLAELKIISFHMQPDLHVLVLKHKANTNMRFFLNKCLFIRVPVLQCFNQHVCFDHICLTNLYKHKHLIYYYSQTCLTEHKGMFFVLCTGKSRGAEDLLQPGHIFIHTSRESN